MIDARLFSLTSLVFVLLHQVTAASIYSARFSCGDTSLEIGEHTTFSFFLNASVPDDVEFEFTYWDAAGNALTPQKLNDTAIALLDPIVMKANQSSVTNITIKAIRPGQVLLGLNTTDQVIVIINLSELVCHVSVMHYKWLDVFQIIIGWTYFAAWTISFYPQIILNWRRKSVIGLNFDFVILNIVGFLVYSIFNIGLFWIKPIQAWIGRQSLVEEIYKQRHPFGTIPVMANDVFFGLHAFIISLFVVVQILCYKRANQRVSKICIGILVLIGIYCLIICSIAGASVINWLDCLYYLSYVKLFITLIKYTPQAIMNCRRHSTVGWSIMNIILDLTGGVLSILQMFIVAYNFDDWSSITGSPIKFGLGIVSLCFDIFFMIQHWCLYPDHQEPSFSVPEDANIQSSYVLDTSADPLNPDSSIAGQARNPGHDILDNKSQPR